MDDLINEEGLKPAVSTILQNVFESCDEEKNGFVKVSKLISFLKDKATGNEILDYLNDLTAILDSDGLDQEIEWTQCEQGMQKWIEHMNKKSFRYNDEPVVTNKISPTKIVFLKNNSFSPKFGIKRQLMYDNSNVSSVVTSTYSNDSMETSDLSWDNSDLQLRLEELEITNKRLLEDNGKLKQHLNSAEDQNSSVLQNNDKLRSKLAKAEKLLDESRYIAKSYEELKLTILEYQSLKNDLIGKNCQLEKENMALQTAIDEHEVKISKLDLTVDVLREEKAALTEELCTHKQLVTQIEDLKTSKEDVIEESANKSDYMTSVIAELSLANDVLKAQKNIVENELSELKQETCRISMLSQFNGLHSTPLPSSIEFNNHAQSLHQELKAELDNSIDGSPIHRRFDFTDDNESNTSSVFLSPSHKDKYSMFAKQCKNKFKEKKEAVFCKLEEIVNHNNDTEKTSIIVDDLNKELEAFTEKIGEFAQGKHNAEKRALKLAAALKGLKEENLHLRGARDKAVMRFGDLSMSSMESEQKLLELSKNLQNEQDIVEKLREEIIDLKEMHENEERHFNERLSQNIESKAAPENLAETQQQIKYLKRLVEDLEARNMENAENIFDLEDIITTKDEHISNEKEKYKKLQNMLSTLKHKHNSELKAIFQMIPNNNNNNHYINSSKHSTPTFKDVEKRLLEFLHTTTHKYEKLMGMRQSPEGGTRLSDSFHIDDIDTPYPQLRRFQNYKEFMQTSCQTDEYQFTEQDIQTELDMISMNKIFETYDMIPTIVEPVVPERLCKHNSVEESHTYIFSNNNLIEEHNRNIESSIPIIIEPTTESEVFIENLQGSVTAQSELLNGSINSIASEPHSELTSPKLHSGLVSSELHSVIESSELHSVSGGAELHSGTVSPELHSELVSPELYSETVSLELDSERSSVDRSLSRSSFAYDSGSEEDTPFEKQVQLRVANIVEFDRSDMSSDSEPENNRRISITRRKMKSYRKSIQEQIEDPKLIEEPDSNNDVPKIKQRRKGVSAEPVRVSWSSLRDSFKTNHTLEPTNMAEESLHTSFDTNEANKNDLQGEAINDSSSVADEDNVKTSERSPSTTSVEEINEELITNIEPTHSDGNVSPTISLTENEDGNNAKTLTEDKILSRKVDDCSEELDVLTETTLMKEVVVKKSSPPPSRLTPSPNLSPKHSLQVPRVTYTNMADLVPAGYETSDEDKELERKFNNVVFSFNTDQFTLQKRLENQERARDVAESGMDKEIAKLSATISELQKHQNGTSEFEDTCMMLFKQKDILCKAAMKISAQSEQHGCYQQENCAAPNIEVMIKYAEHLKINIAALSEQLNECRKRINEFRCEQADISDCDEIKNDMTELPVTESEKDETDETSDTVPNPRKTFSSISKTLLMAKGLQKLRKRNKVDTLTAPKSPKKKVSFGETKFFQEDIITEPCLPCSSDAATLALEQFKNTSLRFFICFCIVFVIYIIYFILTNFIEIDTLRLHDKILSYIPHEIVKEK